MSTYLSNLEAARAGNSEAFAQLIEPHRYELQIHCYRMLGALEDAEDMVQETMLRAWRRLETYDRRAPFRAWLYKIATNICLDSLRKTSRRAVILNPAPNDPQQPLPAPVVDSVWLDPLPEAWLLAGENPSPEARYTQRESVTLAFTTALQRLPPRQRAVLILCDVLDWQARETAELLNMSLSAVNSALFRARNTLGNTVPSELSSFPSDDFTTTLLSRYVHAWETADVHGLVSLLQEEAAFAMPPFPVWFRGRADIRVFLAASLLEGEARGRWKLVPTQANAQPAFAFYRRAEDDRFHAFGLQVVSHQGGQITALTHFLHEGLFARFGLASSL